MMQKEEFENYKHMIVSEQPIFHAYIDMRSNVQYLSPFSHSCASCCRESGMYNLRSFPPFGI